MTEYQEILFIKLQVPLLILFLIAILYFIYNKNLSIINRLIASLYSVIAIAGAVYAIVVCKLTGPNSFEPHTVIFSNILAISVIFGFVSIFLFKGNKAIHLLFLPFLICLAYVWHVGGMAITHTLL